MGNDPNCKSCTLYEDKKHSRPGNVICEVLETGSIGKCPCTNCIIKMTCRVSCDKFDDLMDLCRQLHRQMLREEE